MSCAIQFRDREDRGGNFIPRDHWGSEFGGVLGGVYRYGPATTPASRHSSRGCALGDFDNDGDVDVLIVNLNEPPSLLRNDLRASHHWLKVKLLGTKSNRSANRLLTIRETVGIIGSQAMGYGGVPRAGIVSPRTPAADL